MSEEHTTIVQPTTFRDSIPTVDRAGKRVWLYPRKPPTGKRCSSETFSFYKGRNALSLFLLILLFVGPFIRIKGNPLLMFNIVERKFSIFGFMFWPQDLHLFAVTMVTAMFMIVIFTAVFGRVWCGWLCPQTVLMEMVFRKIEYWIDGDAPAQKKLAAAPWSASKISKRAFKYLVFYALSFIIGNLLLSYVIGSERLIEIISDNPLNHTKGLSAMIIFSLIFFAIFARFREQACTFVCPYGRLQSVLLDENSIVVAYDWVRGDQRAPLIKNEPFKLRQEKGLGDCVDCKMCVEVCPTGIDIRNGTQMECVNCTACIDACNSVMSGIGKDPGLIRYASLNNIAKNEKLKFTPRLAIYTIILCGLLTLLGVLFANRTAIEANLLRTPGTLYQEPSPGFVSNLYNLRLINKSSEAMDIELKLIEPNQGTIQIIGGSLHTESGETAGTAVIVTLPKSVITSTKLPIKVQGLSDDQVCTTIDTTFVGPTLEKETP